MPDFAGILLFVQKRPEFLVLEGDIRSGMKLVEVNGLRLQGSERGIELRAHAGHGKIIIAVQKAFEIMAELGGDEPVRTVAAGQVVADEVLGEMAGAVALGGVNEVDAGFSGGV